MQSSKLLKSSANQAYCSAKPRCQSIKFISKKFAVYWQNISKLFIKKPYYCKEMTTEKGAVTQTTLD